MTLAELYKECVRKIRWIVGMAAVVGAMIFILGLVLVKYQAHATALLKPQGTAKSTSTTSAEVSVGLITSPQINILDTKGQSYVHVATSRSLLREVVTRLGIDKIYSSKDTTSIVERLKQILRIVVYGRFPSNKDPVERAIDRTIRQVEVAQIRFSSLLRISTRDSDPLRAAAIANTLLDVLVEYSREQSRKSIAIYLKWFDTQLAECRALQKEHESLLYRMREKHGLPIFDSADSKKKRLQAKLLRAEDTFENNQTKVVLLKDKIDRLEKILSEYPEYQLLSYTLQRNAEIDRLRSLLTTEEVNRLQLLIDFTPDSLQIKAIQKKMDLLRTALSREVEKVAGSEMFQTDPNYSRLVSDRLTAEIEFEGMPSLERRLLAEIERNRKELKNLEYTAGELDNINRALKGLNKLETDLLREINALNALEKQSFEEIVVLDRATVPRYPSIQNSPLIVFVFIGCIAGAAMAVGFIALSGFKARRSPDEQGV